MLLAVQFGQLAGPTRFRSLSNSALVYCCEAKVDSARSLPRCLAFASPEWWWSLSLACSICGSLWPGWLAKRACCLASEPSSNQVNRTESGRAQESTRAPACGRMVLMVLAEVAPALLVCLCLSRTLSGDHFERSPEQTPASAPSRQPKQLHDRQRHCHCRRQLQLGQPARRCKQ